MTAPDPAYHYEKAKALLEEAENKGMSAANVAARIQLAQTHMDIYRSLQPSSGLSSPA